jgi:outer membrane protein insertion porin family
MQHYSISSITTMLMPLLPGNKTALPDRTYLGGPNSVRGFKIGGMGLRDGRDSLGGDLSWGMGLSVMGPIPGKPQREGWKLRWHSFINAGKVIGYNQGEPEDMAILSASAGAGKVLSIDRSFTDNMTRMYTNPSLSVGLGLMYR